MRLDQRVEAFEHGGQTVLVDRVAEIVVEHGPTELRGVEEVERLSVAQQLVEGFRHRREIQPRSLGGGVGEQALFRQDRLARTRRTHHQRDRVQHQPATEHLVEPYVSGGEPFHQVTPRRGASGQRARTQQVAHGRDELQGHDRLGQEGAGSGRQCLIGQIQRRHRQHGPSTIVRQRAQRSRPPPGDHQIDDRQVWSTVAAQLLGPIRVERHADVVALGAQEVLEQLGRVPIAFGEQHHDRDAVGAGRLKASTSRIRSASSRWASAGVVPASTRSTTNRNRSSSSRE